MAIAITASFVAPSSHAAVPCGPTICTFADDGDINTNDSVTNGSLELYADFATGVAIQQGAISGTGNVVLNANSQGPDPTIVFSGGNHSYTGGTIVRSGVSLQVGTALEAGVLPGDIVFDNSTTLAGNLYLHNVTGRDGAAYDGKISHALGVYLSGAATLGAAAIDASAADAGQPGGTVQVSGSASTGQSRIGGFSQLIYQEAGTAGDSRIELPAAPAGGISSVEFYDDASAGRSTIKAAAEEGYGAAIVFAGRARAGQSTIINGLESERSANSIASPSRNTLQFLDQSSAESATIENSNGFVLFDNQSTAGNSTITNRNAGVIDFYGSSSAGHAIIDNADGAIVFEADSTATDATIRNAKGSVLDISQNNASQFFVGHLEGDGDIYLGDRVLAVGAGNGEETIGALHDGHAGVVDTAGVQDGVGGALLKRGSGKLTLTGDSTHTGGTAVVGGMLQLGNGGAAGSITGDIRNDGVLAVSRSDRYVLDGTIHGVGAFLQDGPGTTVLANDHSYTGGTRIARGTLQLGDGGTHGSVLGGIVNDGVLAIDRSDTYRIDGLISGTGLLLQQGSGTTVLAADNTFSGDARIAHGTLQLGAGNASGGIQGDIVNDGALSVDRSDSYVLKGLIRGAGAFYQEGSGTTILTADNTYTGGTVVTDGTLQLGGGGTSGGLVGDIDVAADAVLSVSRSNDIKLAGIIRGAGAFVQDGEGTTVLSSDNSYTGGTRVVRGTLQVGDGGSRGSVTGDIAVAEGARFAVDRDDDYTVSGIVRGAGVFSQSGTGTTILLGDNDYSGGTDVAAGILQIGGGGDSGSIVGDIAIGQGARVAVDRSDTFGLAGLIRGAGAFAQEGAGRTVFTGDNTYSGGTDINRGVLQLGAGGTAGGLQGAVKIADGATLALNRSDGIVLEGEISGNGSLVQMGQGVATLNNSKNFTGEITILSGTLDLRQSNDFANGIVNNGELILSGQQDAGFGGTVTGSGATTKSGAGLLRLTGDVLSTGRFSLLGGNMETGSDARAVLIGGDFHQAESAGLAGFAKIAGDAVFKGRLTPGAAATVGTLEVGKNLVLGATSRLSILFDASGKNSSISVGGKASVGGVLFASGARNIVPERQYTIISASGGIDGAFNGIESDLAFLTPTLHYDANNVFVELSRNAVQLTDVASTVNQKSVASAVGALGSQSQVYAGLLGLDATRARAALDSLSGEVHATVGGNVLENNARMRAALLNQSHGLGRLPDRTDNGPQLWAMPYRVDQRRTLRSHGDVAGFHENSGGIVAGIENCFTDHLAVGVAGEIASSDLDMPDRASKARIFGKSAGVYVKSESTHLSAVAGFVRHANMVRTSRNVGVDADVQTLDAKYALPANQIFFEGGLKKTSRKGEFGVFASISQLQGDAVHAEEDGMGSALKIQGDKRKVLISGIAARAAWNVNRDGSFVLRGLLGWEQTKGDVETSTELAFKQGGSRFSVVGMPMARSGGNAEFGAKVRVGRNASVDFSAGANFSAGSTSRIAQMTYSLSFR